MLDTSENDIQKPHTCNIPSNQMTAYNFDVTVIQLVKETIQLMLKNYSKYPLSCF